MSGTSGAHQAPCPRLTPEEAHSKHSCPQCWQSHCVSSRALRLELALNSLSLLLRQACSCLPSGHGSPFPAEPSAIQGNNVPFPTPASSATRGLAPEMERRPARGSRTFSGFLKNGKYTVEAPPLAFLHQVYRMPRNENQPVTMRERPREPQKPWSWCHRAAKLTPKAAHFQGSYSVIKMNTCSWNTPSPNPVATL